jgi:eukaryotic-like serine/threonine-protein kinase
MPAETRLRPVKTTRAMTAADTIKEIVIDVKRCTECGARFGVDAAFCPFDGSSLAASTWDRAGDPRAHIKVDDRYEVLEPLGEGGMGTVYKVRHIALDRHFAMKVLRRDLALDADLAARFLQEARATAAIRHPSVVAITDFGEMEDGIPYFVMELLEGETLSTRIRARGPVPPNVAIALAKQIAAGLQASHAANVIHRDLKPDNVFLVGKSVGRAAEAEIRIVDFGAAKIVGGSKLTRPGIVFGTPYYMSPEQASGQPVDARADVYSLGILLYEMITGRVPFEADTYMGVLTKHIFETPGRPVPPSGIALGALEDVVMRALQKDPAARFASMAAFAAALDGASVAPASHSPRGAPHGGPGATVRIGSVTTTTDRIEPSVQRSVAAEERRSNQKLLFGVLAVAGVLILAAIGLKLAMSKGHTAESGPAAPLSLPSAVAPVTRPVVLAETLPTGSGAATPLTSESATATEPATAATAPVSLKRGAPAASPAAHPTTKPTSASATVPARTSGGGPEDFKDPWKH